MHNKFIQIYQITPPIRVTTHTTTVLFPIVLNTGHSTPLVRLSFGKNYCSGYLAVFSKQIFPFSFNLKALWFSNSM